MLSGSNSLSTVPCGPQGSDCHSPTGSGVHVSFLLRV
uniref:Uncharacterized protein n=1 Tax=Anguilla anguilla TaxID=7936 RepID=A0A0E9PSN1_ANGAN